MKTATNQSLVACCVAGLFVAGAYAQDPTFSLVVSAVNGIDLPKPLSSIDAERGDILRVQILLRDWSAPRGQGLRGYQATIDYDGYLSGCAGNVYPVDFAETTDLYGHCTEGGPVGIPNPNAFIDESAECFVFFGGSGAGATGTLSCDYTFTAGGGGIPQSDPDVLYCCGTLDLEVSADAAGTFTLGFFGLDPWGWTYLRDEQSEPIEGLVGETITITLPVVPEPVSSYPPDRAIDARQPSDLDCTEFFGWDAIEITFDCDTAGVQTSDFTVTVDPADITPPAIVAVEPDGNAATLRFDVAIPTRHWTVVMHKPTGSSTRIGYLPADVNGNGTSGPVDILDLIDHLNHVIELPEWSTDVDRTDETNPADILTLIDLLNGAGCFDPWNGETLPE